MIVKLTEEDANLPYFYNKDEIPKNFTGVAIVSFSTGTKYKGWFEDGELHREDGPAVIMIGSLGETWYYKGLRHRIGGPAQIYYSGSALLHSTSTKVEIYMIYGTYYSSINFWKHPLVLEYKLNKILEL